MAAAAAAGSTATTSGEIEVVPIGNSQPPAAAAVYEGGDDDEKTVESRARQIPQRTKISVWRLVFQYSIIAPEVRSYNYDGKGSDDDPFIVDYLPGDPVNPHNWPNWRRWVNVCIVGFGTLAVAVCTSAYLSALPQLQSQFHSSEEVITLGLSFFILGFSVGPLLWGPLSEECKYYYPRTSHGTAWQKRMGELGRLEEERHTVASPEKRIGRLSCPAGKRIGGPCRFRKENRQIVPVDGSPCPIQNHL